MFSLSPSQVDIWFCQPKKVSTYNLDNEYTKLLSSEEHTKVFRYRFEKDQKTSLYTRALLRYSLSQYLPSIKPQDWQFSAQEKGKLALASNPNNIQFNLSHTKELIAFAVTQQHALGVDVEFLERQNDIKSIAKHYFSKPEISELSSLSDKEQASRFYDYWTLKESYIKAWGLGLSIPLRDFSFHINASHSDNLNNSSYNNITRDIKLSFAPERKDTPENWKSYLFNISKKQRGALSIHFPQGAPDTDIKLRFFNCIPLKEVKEIALPLDSKT